MLRGNSQPHSFRVRHCSQKINGDYTLAL